MTTVVTGTAGIKTTQAEHAAAIKAFDLAKYKAPKAIKPGPVREVPVADIAIDGTDHRLEDPKWKAKVEELSKSIEAQGQLQAIRIREPERKNGKYLVVFGRRRLEAVKLLGLKTIRAEIVEADQDAAIEQAGVENVQREELDFIEQAEAVALRMDGLAEQGIRGEAAIAIVAQRLGKSPTWVRDRSVLTRLGAGTRKLVRSGRLPLAQAREIAKLADPEAQEQIAQQACTHEDGTFGRSVEWVKARVNESVLSLKQVPWDLTQKFAGKQACAMCEHNSANAAALFIGDKASEVPEIKEVKTGTTGVVARAGVCLKPSCYDVKRAEAGKGLISATKKAIKLLDNPPKDGITVTEAVDRVLPDGLKAASVSRAVKAEIEKPGTSKKKAAAKEEQHEYRESPQQIAKGKLREARDKIFDGLHASIDKLVKKEPLQLVALSLLTQTEAWGDSTRYSNPKKANPHLAKLIKCVKQPTLTGLIELARDIDGQGVITLPNPWGEVEWQAIQWLADAVGHELPAEPKLAEFMPSAAGTKGEK